MSLEGETSGSDHRIDVIRLLCDVADLCGSGGGVVEIVHEAVRRVCAFNGFHAGRAYLLADEDRTRLELVAEHRSDDALLGHVAPPGLRVAEPSAGDAIPRGVLATGGTAWSGTRVESGFDDPVDRLEHAVVLPIRVDGVVVGALQFFSPRRPELHEGVREAIESIGMQLGRVAERQRLEATVQRAASSERTRIVQQLHDTTCQELAALCLSAGRLERRMLGGRDAELESVQGITAGVRQALESLRAALGGLVPPGLQQGSMAMALEHLAGSVARMHGLDCGSRCDVEVTDDHLAAELFCIASEAASSAARHGRGRRIDIELHADSPGFVVLEVRDDRVGIEPGEEPGPGLGPSLMRHRAAALGGRLSITSIPGRGTTVRCEVPNHAGKGEQGDSHHVDDQLRPGGHRDGDGDGHRAPGHAGQGRPPQGDDEAMAPGGGG